MLKSYSLRLLFLLSALFFSSIAGAAPINVLIIGNADPANIAELTNGLRQYSDFGNIDAIEWSDPPMAAALSPYDAVIVTIKYVPVDNSAAWSDIVADFARSGGGVTCGFSYYSTDGPPVDHSRLELPENNPFTRGPRNGPIGTLGEILIPGHPLMASVDELTTAYRYNINTNPNAVVVATFTDGLPLAGYLEVGAGRVVGVQPHFRLDPLLQNNGDFMQLYRNAVVFSVGRPRVLDVSVQGADARIHWRGIGGSRYVLQAANNLLSTNCFTDITQPIALAGPGFIFTNSVDSGALTNHPARFYRVRTDY